MPRWETGSKERLKKAALELFAERGFEDTSVVEIAERARVTTRTFFRYFLDKREVLFAETDHLREVLVGRLLDAPDVADPLQAVMQALTGFDWSGLTLQRQRHAVIAANPGLLERDLIKNHDIVVEFTEILRQRGVEAQAARLATAVGTQVFLTAYGQWLESGETASLTELSDTVLVILKSLMPADRAKI
ncbi:TetR family transcriptional regulator [Amycolatopsis sp. NBC_01480]|uniref:TetR family transcriptional regulator n=1 Tax=Amycolatopsis sp. NBC_01480 TaxID=2903562 RepID=UPI002E27B15A|nr:TetR family transcriptional regulator [Amycolatopsis sp. NBC_01480]